jgi:lysophospholipase L1-like esterase
MKKRITLIGDSIRIGYQDIVRELLAERAEIWSPEANCMHSVHHLFHIQPWYVDPAADIIHFNFGLWDCRRLERGGAENAVPVEVFARNLDFILRKVRSATSARLIWATITPIVQDRYNGRFSLPQDPCRVASDVELYNAAAAPVLFRHGIPVNDLHALVEEHGRERLICDDGVHYTEQGARLLGEQVTEVLSSDL